MKYKTQYSWVVHTCV